MKTVKVRIAVVVDAKGRWNAAGWFCGEGAAWDEGAILDAVYTGMEYPDGESLPEQLAWVTAEIPVPEAPVLMIEGTTEVEP